MRKVMPIIICLLLATPYCSGMPLNKQKTDFIRLMEYNAQIANQSIREDRAYLLDLRQKIQEGESLHFWERKWLINLAQSYNVKNPKFDKASPTWEMLKNRVDIIPISLVIAQAIHESDWGRSRFAMEGHNYFGQHCNISNCGIIPKRRAKDATFEVTQINKPLDCVCDYMHILNTRQAYQMLRQLRADLRLARKQINGIILANGLKYYSEQDTYVKSIKNLIIKYQLIEYDDM